MPRRRRAARKAVRRTRRAATRAVRRGRTSTFGGVSPKGAIKGAIGVSVVRKLPIFNSIPAQYRQPAQMIGLGVGGKAVGIGGMQHFTSTGLSYAIANFMETSNIMGGILGGNTRSTAPARQTV
jgi:hypothetical protein